MLCLRVAHAATGRPKVLKFEGAYHGQHPVGVTSMIDGRPSVLPASDPSGAGASWVERDVLVAPYNDLDTTERILGEHVQELSAVIVEPLHRCIAPRPGFLQGLREVTKRLGVVLVFDEVVTGFRLALGGAQEFYGVSPDLVAYGKALGGGFPLGAYGGRADLMEVVSEHRLPGAATPCRARRRSRRSICFPSPARMPDCTPPAGCFDSALVTRSPPRARPARCSAMDRSRRSRSPQTRSPISGRGWQATARAADS